MTDIKETMSGESLAECVKELSISKIERHIFICADPTIAKCCDREASLESWNYLKKRLKELKLDRQTAENPGCIFRTKANCLRVCRQGPIAVVYPDGVWYHSCKPEVLEEIISSHIVGGKVVTEYAFVTHPLPEPTVPSQQPIATEAVPSGESRLIYGETGENTVE